MLLLLHVHKSSSVMLFNARSATSKAPPMAAAAALNTSRALFRALVTTKTMPQPAT